MKNYPAKTHSMLNVMSIFQLLLPVFLVNKGFCVFLLFTSKCAKMHLMAGSAGLGK